MKNKFTTWVIFIFVFTSINFAQTINVPTDYATIQAAITAAIDGDVIQISAGTYDIGSSTLTVDKSLTFIGEGPSSNPTTIITSTASRIVNLSVTGKSFSFQNLIVEGNTSNNGIYAGGSIDIASLSLQDVILRNCQVGLYLAENWPGADPLTTTVSNISFDNVTLINNKFIGAYIGKTVLSGTVTNSTITGNGYSSDLQSSWQKVGLQFVNFDEASVPQVNITNCIFSNNGAGASDIERTGLSMYTAYNALSASELMTVSGCDFTNHHWAVRIKNEYSVGNTATVNGTFTSNDLDIWFNRVIGTTSSTTLVRRTFPGIRTVGAGTTYDYNTIQAAIDAADPGDVIEVAAGLYNETIVINKPLTLLGATYNINKNGYAVPAGYSWDTNVESVINYPGMLPQNLSQAVDITSSNVTFKGFVVQILNAQANFNGDNLFRVNAGINRPDDSHMTLDNIIIENNILGPTTNTTSQTGVSGRMGLYLASPTYPAHYQGITNSRITGNKIFDALGNGNNVFVWGAAKSYNSLHNADYTGTIIEYNEICGSHRSGIEISGGVSNLQIKNNWIHDNSSENGGTSDPAVKYGNGIVIIRMGSDKAFSDAMGSEDLIIDGNTIEDNEKNAIYMGPFNKDHIIVNNYLSNNNRNAVIVDLTEEYHGGTNPQYDKASNINVSNNNLSGNTLFGVVVVGTPTNGFTLDAEENWWGDVDATDNISGSVDYSPWWGADYVDNNHSTSWTWYTNDVIQNAIDTALAGDVINVAAGTYTENINVNKHLSVIGALSGIDIATFMVPSTDNPIVRISASGISTANPLLIKNLSIHTSVTAPASGEGKMTGVRIVPAVSLSHIKLDNITVIGNNHPYPGLESGFDIAADASVSDLVIVNSLFKDLSYGIISGAITSTNPGTLDDVTISGCEFDHNSSKGLYFERLSNASLSNLYIHDNGSDQSLMASWAQPYGSGIDINLKYGSYSGIVLSALTVSGNGLGAKEGFGIGIKARDDAPSYNSVPATIDDVLVTDCSITGNERGIRAGEPNKSNSSPTNLVITNSTIANNIKTYAGIDGTSYGDLVNYSLANISAENNYWGTILESKIQTKIYNWAHVDYDPWQGKIVTPTNAQTGVSIYIYQIIWSAFGNGHYDFMFYRDGPMGGGGTQVGSTQNNLTTTFAAISSPLDYETEYYWYIKEHSAVEWDEFHFTTAGPNTAYLINPADASTINGTTIYFSWTSLASGLLYYLQIDEDPSFGSPTTIASNLAVYYYGYDASSLVPGSTYKWRVVSKTSGGDILGYSSIWSFAMPGLPISSVLYPTSSIMIYSNPPTLYWYSGVYNPVFSYIVRYWKEGQTAPTSSTPQTNLSGYFNTGSANIYSALTATLDAGATYHWEVAITNGSITSGWSNPTSDFVVYSSTPTVAPVPYPSWPVGGATSYINPPTLYWYLATYATGLQFELQWDDDSNLDDSPLDNSGWITNYYFAMPVGLPSGTIHWRVRSRIGISGTPSSWSSIESFVIPSSSSSVPTPTPTYPTGGTTVYSLTQYLYWFAYSTSTLEYQVNVSQYPDVNGSGELNNANTFYPSSGTYTTNYYYALSSLTAGTTYYWQIKARVAGSPGTDSPWSSVVSFTTAANSFAVVPLIGSPNFGQPISSTSAVLSWIIPTQSESPLTYEVEFSKSKDMSNAVSINCDNKPFAEIDGLDTKTTYYWRVKSRTDKGSVSNYSAIGSFKTDKTTTDADEVEIPTEFSLMQNYPNPFNPTTRIVYTLPKNSFVTLKIYDVLGREVKTLVNKNMNAGKITVDWNGDDNYGNKVATGAYIYQISTGNFTATKKMLLIK